MAGAFGNPLSAGIALQMDTNKIFNDERKLRLAEKKLDMGQEAARASQRKKDEKELAGILGKITSDDSKVWWRYQDDAKNSYANTIRDVSNAWKAGDYNSAYTKMNDHNVKMTGLVQATKVKDDWITRSMKGDVYTDNEFLKALEDRNVPMTSLAQMGHGYGMFNDDSGTLGFSPLTQIMSVDNVMADALKASSQTYRRDPITGETMITGSVGAGLNKQDQYMTQKGDREGAIASVLNAYGTNMAAKQGEIQRLKGWDYLESLDKKITNPSDPAEVNKVLNEELAILAGESYDKQAYEEKILGKPTQPRPDPGPTPSPPGVISTGATENTTFSVRSSVADPDKREKAINTVMNKIPTQDYRPTNSEWNASLERNLLDQLGYTSQAEYVYSHGAADKVKISKKNSSEEITLNLDDTFRDNLQTFLNDNTNEVLVEDSSQAFYATPENTGNRITEGVKEGTKDKTATYGKTNPLNVKKGILVGDKGAIGFNANNPFPLNGNIQQVYKELTIDDRFFEDLKKKKAAGNTNAHEDLILKMISNGDLKTNETYFKIVPLSPMEPQDPNQQEYNNQFSTQFSGSTGFNEADDGKVQYALIQANTEAKAYFKDRYGFTPESTLEPITNPYSTPQP